MTAFDWFSPKSKACFNKLKTNKHVHEKQKEPRKKVEIYP